MFQKEGKSITDENEDVQQLCEKIEPKFPDIKQFEPKLPDILLGFKEVLKKHGFSEFAVVEFRLDASTKLDEALEVSRTTRDEVLEVSRTTRAARGFCCWNCGHPTKCCGICP